MKKKYILQFICLVIIQITSNSLVAQSPFSNSEIKNQIAICKNDIRGTYKSIQWFCNDGTVRPPKDPCPEAIDGIQHATYKDKVIELGKRNSLFFGQILAYTAKEEFWDVNNNHSRLKQYMLGKYLMRVDDGWINRKGQFYRGAIQIEDEEEWGIQFYHWLLNQDNVLKEDFYLVLQSLKEIPHRGDSDIAQLMRAQSKYISDQYKPFMDLRIKIHSNPEPTDLDNTIAFAKSNKAKLTPSLSKKMDELIETMRTFHQDDSFQSLGEKINTLSTTSSLRPLLKEFMVQVSTENNPQQITETTAEMILRLRKSIFNEKNVTQRLVILDIINHLDALVFKESLQWQPTNVLELLQKNNALAKAAAGVGLIELWEWEEIAPTLAPGSKSSLKLFELSEKMVAARGVLEWSTGMVNAVYGDVVETYTKFEPLAYGFTDDRIRSSIALPLGKTVGELGALISKESQLTNQVLQLENQSTIRGLNPGYAFGELVVVEGSSEDLEVSSQKIYVFDKAPSDLKPVAGIATVSEGNLVSHVQLLARNLAIPNIAISKENFENLKKYNGTKVFFAVSNKGNVILKTAKDMTVKEAELFTTKERKDERVNVPVDQLKLSQNKILNLREVNANDSGKLCGPKAANLGQLKALYPDKVVEGLVIPFGIFKVHMLQPMPGYNGSYWDFLNATFKEAEQKLKNGNTASEIENYQLQQMAILREAIKTINLKPEFIEDINTSFQNILGKPIGSIPVFLRSDTNMEDLKDFTGAGLNLTIFNAANKDKILQGIKDVWASPYTERSFKWRQKFLLNPENVYPSILVIPSVDVDYSGVLITKGITSGNESDLTIAFSRGAGGAVDGQAAESYILKNNGNNQLVAPAREPNYKTLPVSGGTGKGLASFNTPILNEKNIRDITVLATSIKKRFAKETDTDYAGAYDVELGFKEDRLWLFQIRPFVENKKALGSDYLDAITPKIDKNKIISLAEKI